jgi:putative endonuclease
MYFFYILSSEKDSNRYIGFTKNIEKRLNDHNSGLVKSTRSRRPFKLIYYEKIESKSEALKHEKEIKAKKGKFNFTN